MTINIDYMNTLMQEGFDALEKLDKNPGTLKNIYNAQTWINSYLVDDVSLIDNQLIAYVGYFVNEGILDYFINNDISDPNNFDKFAWSQRFVDYKNSKSGMYQNYYTVVRNAYPGAVKDMNTMKTAIETALNNKTVQLRKNELLLKYFNVI